MDSQVMGVTAQMSSRWPRRTGVSRTELNPVSFLYRSVAIHPERVAVVHGDRRYTYAELGRARQPPASALAAAGWSATTALPPYVPTCRPCSSCTTACPRPAAFSSRSTLG